MINRVPLNRICLSILFTLSAQFSLAKGGVDTGGGNFVGKQLFDDYEIAGSKIIPPEKLKQIAMPYLKRLEKEIPDFAADLETGFYDIKWYKESHPLAQLEGCLNGTFLNVNRTVLACQSPVSVRIQKAFYESGSDRLKDLIIHELLQRWRLSRPDSQIIEEQLFVVSRAIRNFNTSPEEIAKDLEENGFVDGGENQRSYRSLYKNIQYNKSYMTVSQLEQSYLDTMQTIRFNICIEFEQAKKYSSYKINFKITLDYASSQYPGTLAEKEAFYKEMQQAQRASDAGSLAYLQNIEKKYCSAQGK